MTNYVEKENTQYNLFNDIVLAKYAYAKCEEFIRSCEAKNSNNEALGLSDNSVSTALYDSCVKDFDYYIVGCVLSMADGRRESFNSYVTEQAKGKADLQKRAYDWLMVNAVYENYTMFVLEQFKQAAITKNKDADVWNGFVHWIKSKTNGDGTFTFFDDTANALKVR